MLRMFSLQHTVICPPKLRNEQVSQGMLHDDTHRSRSLIKTVYASLTTVNISRDLGSEDTSG